MNDATSKTKAEGTTATPARKKAKPATRVTGKTDKPKHETVDNPVVFAFRLSVADRKRIHNAAGSAKASRFVLAAALAAADGDVEAFKRVVATRATK